MGTRTPCPPPDYGNDCPTCTPSVWATGETPVTIYAYCSGFIACPTLTFPLPNGITFLLAQNPFNPCRWTHSGIHWLLDFFATQSGSADSFIQLTYDGNVVLRESSGPECPAEHYEYPNPVTDCLAPHTHHSGTIRVFWNVPFVPPAEGLGADCIPDLMMEWFDHPDGDVVKKFVNQYLRANLRVKVTP